MTNTYTSIQKTELNLLRDFAYVPHTPIELYLEDSHVGNNLHSHNYWEVLLSHQTPSSPIEGVTIIPPCIIHSSNRISKHRIFFDVGGIFFRCSANFDRAIPSNAIPLVKVLQAHLLHLQKSFETLPDEVIQPLMEQHIKILGKELALIYQEALKTKDTAVKHQPPKNIVGYLIKYASQPDFTIANMATVLGISPTNISRIFKREFGCSARHFLILNRLRHACEILAREGKEASVFSVSKNTGWSSPKYFKQVFKRVLHMTPRQFVERYHEKHLPLPDILFNRHTPGSVY